MGVLTWQIQTNIENSIKKFLDAQILTESIQLLDKNGDAVDVTVRVGRELNKDWDLPLIQLYVDSKTSERLEIGSNLRLKDYLVIIESRVLFPGQDSNLAEWLEEKIKNGMTYYEYTVNVADPESPTETDSGRISLDFLGSNPVLLGEDVDLYDKYRYRTTIKCWIK